MLGEGGDLIVKRDQCDEFRIDVRLKLRDQLVGLIVVLRRDAGGERCNQ